VENDTFLRVWRLAFDLAEHTGTCPNHNVTRNLIGTLITISLYQSINDNQWLNILTEPLCRG
jgi:hypothetical protein